MCTEVTKSSKTRLWVGIVLHAPTSWGWGTVFNSWVQHYFSLHLFLYLRRSITYLTSLDSRPIKIRPWIEATIQCTCSSNPTLPHFFTKCFLHLLYIYIAACIAVQLFQCAHAWFWSSACFIAMQSWNQLHKIMLIDNHVTTHAVIDRLKLARIFSFMISKKTFKTRNSKSVWREEGMQLTLSPTWEQNCIQLQSIYSYLHAHVYTQNQK